MKLTKKAVKGMLVLLCIFCLCMGSCMRAEASPSEKFSFYEDGDVVGFIGDSITHAIYTPVNYVNVLSLYYLSRFPQQEVEFRNLGAAGYKISDVLNIYDQDPAFRGINKAVIMLGTNEAILGISSEDYISNMEKLIERLKEDGLKEEDILILSPPICDQNCSLNYGSSGKPRWTYESRLLEYMDMLKIKTAEWGVGYLDIHTPMAELTEEIQKEDRSNTLTTDCIHPNTTGQMLIAYYILQLQGAGDEPLSGIFVPEDGGAQAVHGELTDFYRGERGICWTFKSETLPVAATAELLKFQSFLESAGILYEETLQIKGLSEDIFYTVYMGETELGTFSGRDLADGIDLAALENHPMQMSMQQIDDWSRKRHQEVVEYRNIWVEIAMQRAVYEPDPIQSEYEKWRTADEELRNMMYATAQDMADSIFHLSVIEEGYSVEELEQDKKEAEEQAKKEAEEQASREAEEQAKREAEEQAKREAEEQAKRKAEQEAEEAQRAAEEKAERELFMRKILIGTGVSVIGVLVVLTVIQRKRNI
ncbi:MAG: GDSL-type esterase/lipase family protein [Acetatifactor sp.]